ncbi:MAG: transporter [Methylococcaceae bacterium]|jgi:hypothetical protein
MPNNTKPGTAHSRLAALALVATTTGALSAEAESARPAAAPAPAPASAVQVGSLPVQPKSPARSAKQGYTFTEAMGKSIWGDVYAHPEDWQALSYDTFFSKGWDQPWVSPPNGGGDAPRQGWLLAFEGVFYRLGIASFSWQPNLAGQMDGYSGNLINFTPINQRLNIQTQISVLSNGVNTSTDRQTNFGDFQIQPRFMLSESKNLSQSFNINFRTPTGNPVNGAGVASIGPQYQFWANWWKGLVIRGGTGFTVPYAGDIQQSRTRSTYDANLAIGYYLTPHNYAPFLGDLVGYVATNLTQVIDNRGPVSQTLATIGPGFRSHVVDDWYLLGAVEVPVTYPQPYDYQVLGGIMKVY